MKIYVDELPKSCEDCKFGYFYDCQHCFLRPDLVDKREWCEKNKHCKLKPLSVALAEERKKVVQEIRDLAGDYFEMPYCDACGNTDFNDVVLTGKDLTEILDDVERGE